MNQERILYEDKDIIVCHKAAGIATQTARVGQADMVSEVSNYLKSAPYLGVVHRLDQCHGLRMDIQEAGHADGLFAKRWKEQYVPHCAAGG